MAHTGFEPTALLLLAPCSDQLSNVYVCVHFHVCGYADTLIQSQSFHPDVK